MVDEPFNKDYNNADHNHDSRDYDYSQEQPDIKKVVFQQLQDSGSAVRHRGIPAEFHPVNLKISAELGKVKLKVRELINLEESSVLRLNRAADEKVLILVNDAPFAHGEIVVINDRFGVRVTSLIDREEGEENDSNKGKEGA
jgi:flagellar motor switch protein FliN/FliY